MALRCRMFRGLVKEAEEEIDKFLSTHSIRGALPPQLQYLKRYATTF